MPKPKYTKTQLKNMAITLSEASENDPDKFMQFVITVSMIANISPDQVIARINHYGNYNGTG